MGRGILLENQRGRMITCSNCKSPNGTVTSQVGSLVTWICRECGTQNTAHLNPKARTLAEFSAWMPPQPGDPTDREVEFRGCRLWGGSRGTLAGGPKASGFSVDDCAPRFAPGPARARPTAPIGPARPPTRSPVDSARTRL